MTNRSVHTIFEPSGLPIPSEEEVRFEAQEIVSRSGWGLPLIEALRKVRDPYWREAVARCLMENWVNLVRDKDEQTYYYDSDGDMRYCWMDAECDFSRIIRRSTHEQAAHEQATTENEQPKHEHRIMEQKYTQNNQYNHCVIYNAPVYNTNTTNNYYSGPSAQEPQAAAYTPTDKPETALYPFVMPEKLKELGTCTMADFENKYRKAVSSGANVLAPFLVKYRDLHVLEFGKRTKKDIYEVLKAFFGDDLKFGYPNFAAYY